MECSELPTVEEDPSSSKEMHSLCLEDATDNDVPKSYKNLISKIPEDQLSANKICAGMLCILAAESGFVWDTVDEIPLNERCYFFNIENVNSVRFDALISSQTTDEDFFFTLFLGASKSFKCYLSIKPCAGLIMIVNFYSKESPCCFSKTFVPSLYVRNNTPNFDSVKQWCVRCKNDLFYPMKLHILREVGIKNATLFDLPYETITELSKFIGVKNFLKLCSTCQHFHDTFEEAASIWKYYCRINELDVNKENSIRWKIHFRDQMKSKKKKEKIGKVKCRRVGDRFEP